MSDDLWNRYMGADYVPTDYLFDGGNIESRLRTDLTELWNGEYTDPGDRLNQDEINSIASKLTRYLKNLV